MKHSSQFAEYVANAPASLQMFNQVPVGGHLSVANVVKVLEKRFPYVEISSVLGADSSYDGNRKVR